MLGALEQKKVDDFESDFLNSNLGVYDLSSCLAGYLKGILVERTINFDNEEVRSKFIELLTRANEKKWPPTETTEKKAAREFFWGQVKAQSTVDKALASFARCCVFCAHNDEDWDDHSLGEETPFLLYADELERMGSGQAEKLISYFRTNLCLV